MAEVIDPEVGLDNIRIEPASEDEGYEIQPICLMDNGIIIFDPVEFTEKYSCDALQYTEGGVYVLDKDSRKWRNIEDPVKKTKLTPVN